MDLEVETLQGELAAIVGPEHVSRATAQNAVNGVVPALAVTPGSAEELARVLALAQGAGLAVLPCGGGTKLAWGNPPRRADLLLSTRRLDRLLEHAWGDMTVTVEAGCTLARLQEQLAQHGQRLALDVLWPERATIGGVLATNDSGALRVRFGALRDLVLGVTVALSDGTLARSGGKVVKNVAGYDLPKLMTGALGTLGVVVQVSLRLYPLPRAERTLAFTAPAIEPLSQLLLQIRDSLLVPTGLQLRAGAAETPRVELRFEGVEGGIAAQTRRLLDLAAPIAGVQQAEVPGDVWRTREELWQGAAPALVCKLSVPPNDLAALCDELRRVATPLRLRWRLVAQAVGVALLRLEGASEQALLAAVGVLRPAIEAREGSLVLLDAPAEVKSHVDVWGSTGDTLPLMRRVKEHFDPQGILNPGRFVGGI